MASLEEFEKNIAEEKKSRNHISSRVNSEIDSTRSTHRRRHGSERNSREGHKRHSDSHRHKRLRRIDDNTEHPTGKLDRKQSSPHRNPPDSAGKSHDTKHTTRDAWMEAPLASDLTYVQKRNKNPNKPLLSKSETEIKLHKNELNRNIYEDTAQTSHSTNDELPVSQISYTFGDEGSQWRMTKLKAIYTQAEQNGRPIDEVALERFGDLREFDDAREEEIELERQKTYGEGYQMKLKPDGGLFRLRKPTSDLKKTPDEPARFKSAPELGTSSCENTHRTTEKEIDATDLNRLKAQLMKEKLKNGPDVLRLEGDYNQALEQFNKNSSTPQTIVLGLMDTRNLAGTRGEAKSVDTKRGRERNLIEDNEDMTIEDMVREERRTKGQVGGQGKRAAERIANDAKFSANLDYMEENVDNLAKQVHKSDTRLKNIAINEYKKMDNILNNCQLCHHEDKNQPPIAPVISLATRVYLTLPTEPELNEGGAVIVPLEHRVNLLECDDDEWEEIRNFMKCLTRMYHDQGRDVVFYENAAAPHRKMHAAMQVVPLPYSLGETAPAFFKEAILAADEEWTQHKKLLDTAAQARGGLGKRAFRQMIAKEMPYFHAWFTIDGGLGHIVEDSDRWPKGDLFAREVIGGMLDLDSDIIRRQGRWKFDDKRIPLFRARWRKFDWTRVLTDQ
ncbi:BgTH12-07158 [Blumeria graminis f. sp. triticale]|uniref:BgTH12-07158 n=1 Tax=Blumeria graminis f. sp. triticale TaxID=1689686 RepID=A0A9W4DT79_BLUGR|nr:BgTH12-07158 [Blumeria graminis f. sp. triticale]